MTTILTRAQMQAADRIAIEEVGIPSLVLMEVAGRAVADVAESRADKRRVVALAGTGNNGGDAVVAARHLKERGADVTLVVLGDEAGASRDMAAQLAMARALGIVAVVLEGQRAVVEIERFARRSLLIDGIFGTGLTRPIDGWRADAIQIADASAAEVVAIDVPSGIDADTGAVFGVAFHAAATVTFQCPKYGHVLFPGRAHTGELTIADIGIPQSRLEGVSPYGEVIEDAIVSEAWPVRALDTHKGTYGHLLVIAGAPDRPGAMLLAGRAALRAGTGLVTVASDAETIRRTACTFDELMGRSLGDAITARAVIDALEKKTALAIGPSLEPDPRVVREILTHAAVPVVVDAGAVVALGADPSWLASRTYPTILTPHPGEMAKILGGDTNAVQSDRVGVARAVAQTTGAYVVLKGASTVVASPDGRVGIAVRGNAGMATGGAGDVLTGIIGALLAQGVEPELAARAGVQAHAWAGDRAAAKSGEARVVASDLIAELPLGGSG
jgi:ADP-dependent NAD(P)H-hydrate dehydratase / NAD(P)H-hydrate epimerase